MSTHLLAVGDVHGEQDTLYSVARAVEQRADIKLDAILQVGDFESLRDEQDLKHYYAPPKYQHLGDFVEYYSGAKQAPIPTFFIGGNHEAWEYLKEFPEGGFVAPNMYYIGRSGTVEVEGLRVGGVTGIYNPEKYREPLPEEPEYSWRYYREEHLQRLEDERIDILLLHDWPLPIEAEHSSGRYPASFLDAKPTPTRPLIESLRPTYALAGHMHKFHIEQDIGKTRFIGLSRLHPKNPHSWRLLSF